MAAPEQTLEEIVRDQLRAPVTELVRRLVPELVAEALSGSAARSLKTRPDPQEPATGPATKTCTTCGETKPRMPSTASGSSAGPVGAAGSPVASRARARRGAHAGVKAVDGWKEFFARQRERPPAPKRRIGKTLVGQLEQCYAEERRQMIEEARANGVSLEKRDGRVYRVLHLPTATAPG